VSPRRALLCGVVQEGEPLHIAVLGRLNRSGAVSVSHVVIRCPHSWQARRRRWASRASEKTDATTFQSWPPHSGQTKQGPSRTRRGFISSPAPRRPPDRRLHQPPAAKWRVHAPRYIEARATAFASGQGEEFHLRIHPHDGLPSTRMDRSKGAVATPQRDTTALFWRVYSVTDSGARWRPSRSASSPEHSDRSWLRLVAH